MPDPQPQQTSSFLADREAPGLQGPPEPPQQDYREHPNLGQQVGDANSPAEHDPHPEANTAGHFQSPQPAVGGLGYSLNAADAPPNIMVPDNPPLHVGQTPWNPDVQAASPWQGETASDSGFLPTMTSWDNLGGA